ncbi:MAG: rhomboid family intramembrane serine protease [Halanaerobiaceae bacterium]
MLPLGDNVPRQKAPVMTWILLLLNVFIFIYQLCLPRREIQYIFYQFGLIPRMLSTAPLGNSLNLLTSMFVHGSLVHLLGNMWILWLFGDNVEDRMGHIPFFFFYLLSGVVAAIFHVVYNPASAVPTIGASGAIAGVMAAYLFLFPLARVRTLFIIIIFPYFIDIPSFVYIGIWFLTQLYYGAISMGATAYHGVAWWAHIGGFLFGAFFYRKFLKKGRNRG